MTPPGEGAPPVASSFEEGLAALDADLERKLVQLVRVFTEEAEAALAALGDGGETPEGEARA